MKEKLKGRFSLAFLGNLLEHYDTALFGMLSPLLAPRIFPEHDPLIALALTYMLLPLSLLTKPLGALFFGNLGDKQGREKALFISLLGIGATSFSMAFIPLEYSLGVLPSFLFCLGKSLQNFFAAGEVIGGSIFILENTKEKKQDILSGLYGASSIGGQILASFGVYILSKYGWMHAGWRFLYLFGGLTVCIAWKIRKIPYAGSSSYRKVFSTDLRKNLWENRYNLLSIMVCSGFSYATYSIAFLLINGLIPFISSMPQVDVLKINSYLLCLDLFLLPLFGWIASKVSREIFMLTFSLLTCFLALPFFTLLEGANTFLLIGIRVACVILGVAFFAPFYAWAKELVAEKSRYLIISLGYILGAQILGSPTASIAVWCFKSTGKLVSVAWYWMFLALLSSIVIWVNIQLKKRVFV